MAVMAHVLLQDVDLRGDCAYSHETEPFDCEPALDAFDTGELAEYADDYHDKGILYYGDYIYRECVEQGLCEDWDGPFEFYIDDDDAYRDYYVGRCRADGIEVPED